ncbi:hypothetical protein HKD37_17G048371 [Glycine soja]
MLIKMATPPSSPPPPPPTGAASQSSSILKQTRKATRLRSLATRPVGAERPLVHVDPVTGKANGPHKKLRTYLGIVTRDKVDVTYENWKQADGPHKKKLRTYLGIIARDKVDVTYENWKQVPAAQKDLIWDDVQVEFDIPEASDVRTKKKILKTLTRIVSMTLYAKNTALARRNGPNFVRAIETLHVRKKAQAIQKQNTTPHVLSRGGYEYLEKKMMDEKTKKKLESTDTMIDPPSPIRHHDSLEEQASQGSFATHGRQDVLIAAIGRPEHLDRVRVAGANVTIKQYFGSAPRTSRTSSLMAPEDLEDSWRSRSQKSDSTADVILQPDAVPGLALPPEPEVGPSAARVSTKESCVDPSGNDPDTGDSDKPENPPRLVAIGRVYEGSTTVFNIPLLHDQVKVSVEEVRDADAPIPIPTEEVKLVGQALNTFLAWPTHLGAVGPTKLTERLDHEVDDPLYLMTLTIPQLFLKPLQVMWDATVFGLFNEDFPLYIKHEDLSEIAHNGQCLIISIIQLWILHMTETSMRAGNSDVYGFHEPQSIQRSGQSQFES